jgi:hypothetical protein
MIPQEQTGHAVSGRLASPRASPLGSATLSIRFPQRRKTALESPEGTAFTSVCMGKKWTGKKRTGQHPQVTRLADGTVSTGPDEREELFSRPPNGPGEVIF